MRKFVVLLAVAVLAAFGSSATVTEAGDTYAYQVNALRGSDTSAWSIYAQEEGDPQGPCPGGSDPPTSTPLTVEAVPIVVASTTADYFVLYAQHAVDANKTIDLPVLVKRGEVGTTTLSESVAALPKDRYRVEKYLVANPADIDGDCIDDITELGNPATMSPVNPAASMMQTDGAVIVPDQAAFDALAREGTIKFVLVGLRSARPSVYFMNVRTHAGHTSFMNTVGIEWGNYVTTGALTYSPLLVAPNGSSGLYYFDSNQTWPFESMERIYALIAANLPLLDDNLALYTSNRNLPYFNEDAPLYRKSRINLVFEEDIFPDADFLALNPGDGYGLLRFLQPQDRPNPRDIVLYEALPNDLPRVAGIISTVVQTPLSHVNLRAVQNAIPNAYIRGAVDNSVIAPLINSYVRYEVTDSGWHLRAATMAEVNAHYASSRPATTQTLQRDLSVTKITPLSQIGLDDWDAFGVKAANVAVLRKRGFPDGTVPNGFAIPFYFYDEFMKHNKFYTRIRTMLADTDFQTNFDTQEAELKKLRKAIEDAETPAWIIAAIVEMNKSFADGVNRRYRSSTNNEDLPGFNGAGLYDSKSQKPSEDEDDLAKSLKEVYASLWNFRAFTERDFHRIDHLAAAMGVLVHPSYQDELVNGVAVSFDPISGRDGKYYVNSQLGEDLVTNPEPHSAPEEILLEEGGSHTVYATSNLVEPGQFLMSGVQFSQLRERLKVIHDHFKGLYKPALGEPFAMEIEFKITSAKKLAIKQARPWVFPDAHPPPQEEPPPPRPPPPPQANTPPEFLTIERGQRTLYENTAAGENIGRPVSAWDPQGDTITYILGGNDANSFDMDASSGQLITKAALDYETKSTYRVIVWIHDGKDSNGAENNGIDASQDVTIILTNVGEAGEITLSPDQPHIGTQLSAIVEDLDGSVSGEVWRWERSTDMSDWSAIAEAISASYTPVEADKGNYLRVTASDSDGHGSGKSASIVSASTVVVNTPPRFPLPELNEDSVPKDSLERMVAENADSGEDAGDPVAAVDHDGDTLTYRLSGEDAQHFDIDETTGQLSSRSVFDYETKSAYSLTVSVMDGKDAGGNPDSAIDDSIAVSVMVVNEGESGNLTLSSAQPRVGSSLVAALTDPDGVVGEVEWVWHRSTNPTPVFETGGRVISGAKTSSYTPVEADKGYYLRVTATYEDGHGPGKRRQVVSDAAVVEFPGPPFPEARMNSGRAPGLSVVRSIAETASAGVKVGGSVVAESPNGNVFTYTLSGEDAALFTIDASTGQISVRAGTELDYESDKRSYTLWVTATDRLGVASTVTVVVQVSDVELTGIGLKYDANNNEVIDREEAIAAVSDYFRGLITKEETIEVIRLYFTG